MIVKNCISASGLEIRDTEYTLDQADSSDLNMKLCIETIPTPLFQECKFSSCSKEHNSDENFSLSSSLLHQLSQKDKTVEAVSMKFVEKFSELKLESPNEVNLESKRADNVSEATVITSVDNCIDQKVLSPDGRSVCTSHEHLPVAKISIKENDRKPICLSCNNVGCWNKPELDQNEEVDTKHFNPLSRSLISRSPNRNGRRHCKVSPSYTIGPGKSTPKQKTAVCVSDTDIFNFHGNSPSAEFNAQLLHGSGGRFSEINPHVNEDVKNLCRIDQEISLEQLESYINCIDKFSPSSVCSISSSAHSSSSSSSVGYLSPGSVNNIETFSGDTGSSSPSVSDLYPTPPSSVFENNSFTNAVSLQTSDYFSESSPDHCASPFNTNDDSLLPFPFLDENFTSADVPLTFSEKSEFDTFSPSSRDEEIEHIIWFLKNGNVNPATAELVTNCSKHFDEATVRNRSECDSASANDRGIQKLDSLQDPLANSHHNKLPPVAAQIPSSIMPHVYKSGNNSVQSTLLLMPVQLQTVTVSGPKDRKNQREIKPNICPVEKEVDLLKNEERCQIKKETGKINSVYPGTVEYKSVKAKICSSITREEKNELLKSALEEKTTTDGSMKLHSAARSGDEKLVYVIIESMRTKIKTENSSSRTDNLNPRISTTEKIHKFVNMQDNHGCTPLYYAALTENNLLIAYLLECGANPFVEDYELGNTPYHIATLRGDSAIKSMKLLSFKRNVTDSINKKGQTVLVAAVINHGQNYNGIQINGLKLIKHLLCNGHKLSAQDAEGKTALHKAVLKKDAELLKVLLAYGTDAVKARLVKDNEGNTILHDAALLANYRLIETVITHCSELTEIRNNKGKLPYELINENKKQERKLLQNKFDECGFRDL